MVQETGTRTSQKRVTTIFESDKRFGEVRIIMNTAVKQSDGFGRWKDVREWFRDALAVDKKTLPSSVDHTIPIPGNWVVTVELPIRQTQGCGDVMEAGLALLTEVGVRPEEAYLEWGCFGIELKPLASYEAIFRAEQICKWLVANGFKVRLDEEYEAWTQDEPALVRVIEGHAHFKPASKWSLSIMIPGELGGAEAARTLAAHLEVTPPPEDDLRVGGWRFEFEAGGFDNAKAKAKQAISWLNERDCKVKTSWGDASLGLDSLDEETLSSLNAIDRYYPEEDLRAWVSLEGKGGKDLEERRSRLVRIAARSDGSAEELTVVLLRREAKVVLDLAAEFLREYEFMDSLRREATRGYHVPWICQYHAEDVGKAFEILYQIVGKLHAAIGRGAQGANSRAFQ